MIVSMQKVLLSQAKLAFILCILSFESDVGISFPFQDYFKTLTFLRGSFRTFFLVKSFIHMELRSNFSCSPQENELP